MLGKKNFKKPSDIKVGVIGYGGSFNMGKVHLNEMKNAGMTPLAVTEIDPLRLKEAKVDFPNIETYTSIENMLKLSKVDLIAIITPHNTHAKLAIQCLKAGKNVICEKPFAITTKECDEMILVAKKNKLLLSAYHNRHWDGCILHALKIIKSGVIGDVVRVEAHIGKWSKPQDWWRSSKSISGGILYDWGVHLLEYSLQIINSEITEVMGFSKNGFWAQQTKWKQDTIEDEAFTVVRFKNEVWLSLCITNIDSNSKQGMLEITGTKGSYIIHYDTWDVVNCKKDGGISIMRGKNPPSQWWAFYKNIADYLTKDVELIITPEWARRMIHIIDLSNTSAKRKITLKPKYK